jgi:homoserine dehydrogenase
LERGLLQARLGILGLGTVGRNVVEQLYGRTYPFDLEWIATSKLLFHRKNAGVFTQENLRAILDLKLSSSFENAKSYLREKQIEVIEFHRFSDEIGFLRDQVKRLGHRLIVIDSSFNESIVGFEIATGLSGCLAFVTANKTPWANHELCKKLYSLASNVKMFLGLNCIQGVWVDQMEYIPLLIKTIDWKVARVIKRDNPSLNLFFSRVGAGWSALEAMAEIKARRYLEPGATDLVPEVKDQIIKLKITANICSAISGYSIRSSDRSFKKLESNLLKRAEIEDLANWHLSSRRNRHYGALLSFLQLQSGVEDIKAEAKFTELYPDHALANDFKGKNAIMIHFSGKGQFLHTGYGGAPRTASKLLWEADRASRLAGAMNYNFFDPMPVITALKLRDRDALKKYKALTNSR